MKTTTLFSLLAALVITLILGLAALTLHSIEKSRWWAERTQLAQESHWLHLQLEANIFRLFKQHGDALLIGDRGGGMGERELMARIDRNLVDIRNTIAREIQLVGEQEIDELTTLDLIQSDVKRVTSALNAFTESGERLENSVQMERLATLLDQAIDNTLTQRIEKVLDGELAEVREVVAAAEVFRRTNRIAVGAALLGSVVLLGVAVRSFDRQIRSPLRLLPERLSALRRGDFEASMDLGGGREFRELGVVLGDMAQALARREAGREEQRRELEARVSARTHELQELVVRLETGDANRRRLMADISHELRTPLAIIRGEADVTLRTSRDLTDALSDTLARIRDAARHTNQMVDDMLTVARHEAGQLRLEKRETDLRLVLRDAVELFPQEVALTLPAVPVRGRVDQVRLRQAILALFQNARRYGGPTISAGLEAEGGMARLMVEDDGPGMTDEEKAQAFERFFRGSNAAGADHDGSGLGLPIVRTIVESHDGHVRLEDVESGGLCVRLEIPLAPPVRLVDGRGEAPRRAG